MQFLFLEALSTSSISLGLYKLKTTSSSLGRATKPRMSDETSAKCQGFADLLEGDVNWPAVMSAIAEIGYSGPVAAEMIPLYQFYPKIRIVNTSTATNAILGHS